MNSLEFYSFLTKFFWYSEFRWSNVDALIHWSPNGRWSSFGSVIKHRTKMINQLAFPWITHIFLLKKGRSPVFKTIYRWIVVAFWSLQKSGASSQQGFAATKHRQWQQFRGGQPERWSAKDVCCKEGTNYSCVVALSFPQGHSVLCHAECPHSHCWCINGVRGANNEIVSWECRDPSIFSWSSFFVQSLLLSVFLKEHVTAIRPKRSRWSEMRSLTEWGTLPYVYIYIHTASVKKLHVVKKTWYFWSIYCNEFENHSYHFTCLNLERTEPFGKTWGSEARFARSNDWAGGEEVGGLSGITTVDGTNP